LERARRRVPLGADETAVVAAVGRRPDGDFRYGQGDPKAHTLWWWYGDDILVVRFDEGGKAVQALAVRGKASLWGRLRAWWPW
jgi:hypothetical protein